MKYKASASAAELRRNSIPFRNSFLAPLTAPRCPLLGSYPEKGLWEVCAYGATGARFRIWLPFLAISDLLAVDWLRQVASTPLEKFIKPIRNRAESVELHPTPSLIVPPSHASGDSGSQADPAILKSADTEVIL